MKWNNIIHIWTLSFSLLIFYSLSGCADARSDPAGDVHPRVMVEDGNFVLYFASNVEKKPQDSYHLKEGHYPPHYNIYKTIISPKGKTIVKRRRTKHPPVLRPDYELKEEEKGIYIKDKEQWLVFPRWPWQHKGKPFMIRLANGKKEKIQFKWDREVDVVHDVIKAKWAIIFIVSFRSSADPDTNNPQLHFCRFRDDAVGLPISGKINEPQRTNDFPVCSNIVEQYPRFFVSWVDSLRGKHKLALSVWNPSANALSSQPIVDSVDRNLSISMARIEDSLLIAYHELGNIKTILIDLKTMKAIQIR